MSQINVGVVAYGFSAKVFHLPFLDACPGYNVKAILQRSGSASAQKYPDAAIVRNIQELISISDIQLIVITSINSTHYEYAKAALLAGKHVVVEKPFTETSAQATELAALAKSAGLVLSVYQNRRYDGDFLTVKTLLASGMLGQLLEFHSRFDRFRLFKKHNSWKEDPSEPCSGILYDLGPHVIDQAVTLFGKPSSVQASVQKQRPLQDSPDDAFTVTLKYDHLNLTAVLSASMITRIKPPRFSLFGSSGSFVKYGLDPQESTLIAGELSVSNPQFGLDSPDNYGSIDTTYKDIHISGKIETVPGFYLGYYQNIRDAINKVQDLYVTPDQAVISMQIIEAAIESNKIKSTVFL
ncbi:hypothetical protein BB561_000236 [Smittium simulii]|uniref:Oxidoreductase n=1 Tax=Smittium simulii TaxID=133385 RepID=A0A2T9YZQ4_9FUNG|nr:hypothetical protein BB561_000236 [Smittium simulii]